MKRRDFLKKVGIGGASLGFLPQKTKASSDLKLEQLTFEQINSLPVGTYIPCELCPQRRFNPDRCTGKATEDGWVNNWKYYRNGREWRGCSGRLRQPLDDKYKSTTWPINISTDGTEYTCSVGIRGVWRKRYGRGHIYTTGNSVQKAIHKALRQIWLFCVPPLG